MIIRSLNRSDFNELSKVLEMQLNAYRVEAELLNVESLPPLKETIGNLDTAFNDVFLAIEGDCIVGAIFIERSDFSILISKLIVDPIHFRKGIAKRLVEDCLNRFSGKEFHVSTARENVPAVNLYQNFGFLKIKEFEVEGGLKLISFKRPSC